MSKTDAILSSYAPGDGSIAFNWHDDTHERRSVNKTVTELDVMKYQLQKTGALSNYIRVFINGAWHLVRPIKRVADDLLLIDKEIYRYELRKRDRTDIWDSDLVVFVDDKYFDRPQLVHNLSIRAAIRFYLNHELEITTLAKTIAQREKEEAPPTIKPRNVRHVRIADYARENNMQYSLVYQKVKDGTLESIEMGTKKFIVVEIKSA